MTPSHDNWIRKFIVSDPRKHKKGFTVYKVTSIVYAESSPEALAKTVVWKRYNDFKKLHNQLQIKHKKLYLKDTFPPFVKAKFFGRFEDDVIEERRKCAESLLEFASQHSALYKCSAFVKFFESGYTVTENIVEEAPIVLVTGSDEITNNTPSLLDSLGSRMPQESVVPRTDAEGPYLKLEGTWKFPQVPDSISWSSHSSDERTTFTDTDSAISGVSTPLQGSDLQFFDPLQSPERTSRATSSQVSNSWLLSMPTSSVTEDDLISYSNEQTIRASSDGNCLILDASKLTLYDSQALETVTKEAGHSEQVNFASELSNCNRQDVALGDIFGTTSGQEAGYIFEAAHHVTLAQQQEANGNYEAAFTCYKTGIACLLNGVQNDPDSQRKKFVRDKTAKYLLQAEKLYNENLAPKLKESFHWNESEHQLSRHSSELKSYKVLGIIDRVMLALNRQENKCYVIKVLHKSPCPADQNRKTILPQNVPYMVKMYHYIDTESAVFLILQHASGGRLWDHISSYFESLPNTPIHISTKGNAYYGKNVTHKGKQDGYETEMLSSPEEVKEVEETPKGNDTCSVSSQDNSYLDLIRDYESASKTVSVHYRDDSSFVGKDLRNLDELLGGTEANMTDANGNSIKCPVPSVSVKNGPERPFPSYGETGETYGAVDIQAASKQLHDQPSSNSDPAVDAFSFSWKNLERLETYDLLENAQKLIRSVNETLLESEVELRHIDSPVSDSNGIYTSLCEKRSTNSNIHAENGNNEVKNTSQPNDTVDRVVCSKTDKKTSKNVIRGKSSEPAGRTRETRTSTNRRRSVNSRSERRFSTDDMCEGRARTMSGSLDRGHQWSRFLSMNDCHRPLLPEVTVCEWAAQLVLCLESLHQWGIICRDLHPDNILLGERGSLLVSYMCQLGAVDSVINEEAVNSLYCAPEVKSIFPVTPAADWWSFGAILFDLLTGKALASCHPAGIQSHTVLNVPDYVSKEAVEILTELLRYDPEERLGSGINGIEKLKSHPFFKGIDWKAMLVKSS
ncbi:ribosomal protein S6 kinase delta-1 [Schistocerca nitens]|uniref:ribosomal protein S6 kinase delta-1 n=1 Tax=Schistocerca nitens TaxID=7011 RepID=UPI0021181CA1|nr:ribosomal protein S6 kinase delta-1 [Schistocerca nitens]